MDWAQIATLLGGFIGGGGLMTLITARAQRKKVGAEADNAAITALNNAITTMTDIDNGKDAEIASLKSENTTLRAQIGDMQTQLADKRCECTTKGYYMCVHQGCVLRRPSLGRGRAYFKEHCDEMDFGADFYTVEELLDEYKKNAKLKMIEHDEA